MLARQNATLAATLVRDGDARDPGGSGRRPPSDLGLALAVAPKAGQRAAAGCDAARTHAGGAVLTFAQQQQQQQAAGSSSLSLHVLLQL